MTNCSFLIIMKLLTVSMAAGTIVGGFHVADRIDVRLHGKHVAERG